MTKALGHRVPGCFTIPRQRVIMITKQHRNDGACDPEEVCLLPADTVESHRVTAVSLLPISYCP